MGSFSLMHWVVVALVVLVLFGRGKISQTMGDFGQGIRSFRKGMSDDDGAEAAPSKQIPHEGASRSVANSSSPSTTANGGTQPRDSSAS